MNDLIFRITPNIVLGSYTITRLGQQVQEFGTRFMVIVDPVLNEVKIQDKVLQTLNDRNIVLFLMNFLKEQILKLPNAPSLLQNKAMFMV